MSDCQGEKSYAPIQVVEDKAGLPTTQTPLQVLDSSCVSSIGDLIICEFVGKFTQLKGRVWNFF